MNQRSSITSEPLNLIDFGMDNIMSWCDYVNTVSAPDLALSFTKMHSKASSMFKEKFVSCIEFIDTDDNYEVFAKVKAEMKKRTVYKVSATISKTNEVKAAVCECAGGMDPAICKHSLALLYAIENYSQKELYTAPTEQLQRWHQMKPKKTSPIKFSGNPNVNILNTVNYESLNNLALTAPIFDVIDKSI